MPFSGGPVPCPGRNVVLLLASHTLARVARLDLTVGRGRYLAQDPLPATMDHLGLRFGLRSGTERREGEVPTAAAVQAVAPRLRRLRTPARRCGG